MPSAADIVDGLTVIANRFSYVSVGWHVLLAVALAALFAGWRPSRRAAGAFLVAPLASVSAVALAQHNPFNGSVLLAAALALLVIALRLGPEPVVRPRGWAPVSTGLALVAYAWVYPHFLVNTSPFAYFYAAPMGVVPCPTLAALVGLSLLANGLASRAWSWVLASVALFYGLFGTLRLGVGIDVFLALGALGLAARGLRPAMKHH